MPNWCATNYAVTGEKNELQQFADLVNSLPSREDVHPNDFGIFWLGNLAALLGTNWNNPDFRGVINPDPEAEAYLFGPSVDEKNPEQLQVVPTPDGKSFMIRFSTQTAWDRPYSLEDLLVEKYPSMEIFYKSTDEFGNFHVIHDPMKLLGQKKYHVWIPDNIDLDTDNEMEAINEGLKAIGREPFCVTAWNEFVVLVMEWTEENDSDCEIEYWDDGLAA